MANGIGFAVTWRDVPRCGQFLLATALHLFRPMKTFAMTGDRYHRWTPLVLGPVLLAQSLAAPLMLRKFANAPVPELVYWLLMAAFSLQWLGLLVTTLLTPRALTLTYDALHVDRLAWPAFRVPFRDILSVERGPQSRLFGRSVRRLFGVGGWFWSGGLFWAEGPGRVRAWLTRLGPTIVVHRRSGLPMLLSVDDTDGFLEAMRARRAGAW